MHPGSHPEQEADADECGNQGGTAAELQAGGRAMGTGDSGEWGWVKWRGGGEEEGRRREGGEEEREGEGERKGEGERGEEGREGKEGVGRRKV